MNEEASQRALERDLRRRVKGDVLFDDVHRVLYSTAACLFQILPRGIVVPKDREDVVATVRFCRDRGLPITARGAASGLAGQTLGEGIVLDFSKYLRSVLEVNQVKGWARVQPGVVLGDLNRGLARYGLWFAPDPSSGDVATLGGMIATNASGARTIKYGPTRDHLLALETVLDDGEIATVERMDASRIPHGRFGQVVSSLGSLLRRHAETIERFRPDAPKNSSGYPLWDLLSGGQLDLTRLIAGSEGTLALVTEAKLRLLRKPPERALLRLLFETPEAACDAVLRLRPLGPSAVELLDRTILDLVRGKLDALPPRAQSVLLVEFDGESRKAVTDRAEEARQAVTCLESKLAVGGDVQELWKIRKAASPVLDRMQGPLRSTRIIEDVCVNPEKLPAYLSALRSLFAKHGVDGVIFGHAGSGHLHVNLLMNPDDPGDRDKMGGIASDLAEIVARLRGTLSGEHGDGILRAPYLRAVYGDLVPVFEEVKRIFDPKGILNPGKKLCPPGYDFRTQLRGSRRPDQTVVPDSPFLPWQTEIERCNGCGHCRTYCPVFQVIPEESATPRAKANLLEGVIEGRIGLDAALESGELRRIADRCINCKLCLVHCPSLVDIPGMCLEAKAVDTLRRGLSRRDAAFASARESASRAARWPRFSRFLLANPVFRQGLRFFRGISARRRFPVFRVDGTQPRKREGAPKVAYFPGCSADFNDPGGERRAAIGILEHNGFEVIVPEGLCCGLPAHSLGSRVGARDHALTNVTQLSRFADEGIPIVVSAASCAMMLRLETPRLVRTLRSRQVAESVRDLQEFLFDLHRQGRLSTNLKRINATCLFHASCHLQAAGTDAAARALLQLIPDLRLVPFEGGCCGMAGSYGFKAETYGDSVAIGHRIADEMRRLNPTFLVTSNGNCRIQLEELTRRPVLHSMTLLHKAYGLSPMVGIHWEHEGLAIQTLAGKMDRSEGMTDR